MSGRPEMSTTLHDPHVEPASAPSAAVALIGPNATHRRVMAKALSGTEARAVREFIDYPANLGDVSTLLEEKFDVVMIDVDSDQSYALQIIEAIAAHNTSIVMAYSMRNDPDLIRECMRAGARDFLPLPEDASAQAEPEPEPELQPVPASVPAPAPALELAPEPVPAPEPAVNPADFLLSPQAAVVEEEPALNPKDFLLATPREVTDASPALPAFQPQEYSVPSRPQFVEQRRSAPQAAPQTAFQPVPRPVAKPAQQPIPLPPPQAAEPRRHEPSTPHIQPDELRRSVPAAKPPQDEVRTPAAPPAPKDEIDAWDSLWIKPVLTGGAKPTEPSVAPAADAAAKKKPAAAAAIPSGPQLVQRAAAAKAEALPPAAPATPMFRGVDSEPSAQQQRPWMRWAILGGAPLAILGLIMLVFLPSHRASVPATQQVQPTAQTQTSAADSPAASVPTSAQPAPKPSAATPVKDDEPQPAPVSSAMMDQQLNAPTRIAGSLRRPTQQADEPPSAFAPGAIDGGNSLPGQVFNQSRGVKVIPASAAISAGVADGMLLHRTSPIYPEIAKSAHVSGTVVLGANITKNGTLTNLHVLSGPAMLREPALDAVKTWRYRPYELNHLPVEVETTIRVVFSLQP